LYTGCPITLLEKHRTRIRDLCEKDPRSKILLTGQSVEDNRLRFAFGGKMHAYTPSSLQNRSDAVKKIEQNRKDGNDSSTISSEHIEKMLESNPEIGKSFVKAWGKLEGQNKEQNPKKEQPKKELPLTRKPRRRARSKKIEKPKNEETNKEGNKNEGSENLNDDGDKVMTDGTDDAKSGSLTDTQLAALADKNMKITETEVDPKTGHIPISDFSGSGHVEGEDSISGIDDISDEGSDSDFVDENDEGGKKK